MITEKEMEHLKRAVELAEIGLEKGDEPFGSVLVTAAGERVFEDHNRVSGGDHTQHPEFAIARWAANNLTPEERRTATVYTSGEHCPMCAAAHGWVGLGRIVYASSSEQLVKWTQEMGLPASPVKNLAIQDVIRDADVVGPSKELAPKVKLLHMRSNKEKEGLNE